MDRTTKIVLVKKCGPYNLYRATNRNGVSELFKLNTKHAYLLDKYRYLLVNSADGKRISRRHTEDGKFVKVVPLGKDVMGVADTGKEVIVDHVNRDRNDYRDEMLNVTNFAGNMRNRRTWKVKKDRLKYIHKKPPGNYMVMLDNVVQGTKHTQDEAIKFRDDILSGKIPKRKAKSR